METSPIASPQDEEFVLPAATKTPQQSSDYLPFVATTSPGSQRPIAGAQRKVQSMFVKSVPSPPANTSPVNVSAYSPVTKNITRHGSVEKVEILLAKEVQKIHELLDAKVPEGMIVFNVNPRKAEAIRAYMEHVRQTTNQAGITPQSVTRQIQDSIPVRKNQLNRKRGSSVASFPGLSEKDIRGIDGLLQAEWSTEKIIDIFGLRKENAIRRYIQIKSSTEKQ